jgi:hypothetical protein
MSNEYKGPAFLAELDEAAVLTAAFMKRPLKGIAPIKRVVLAAASFYESMTPLYKGGFDGKEFIGFKAVLRNGEELHGLVATSRNSAGKISEIDVWHSPLGGLVQLSNGVASVVGNELGPDMFLD